MSQGSRALVRKVPTAKAALRGFPGKGKHRPEPRPPRTTADPPPYLAGAALELWHSLAPDLVAMGVLTRVDRDEFAKGCRLEAEGLKALAELEAGRKIPPTSGFLNMLRQASQIFGRFGIGASDRSRIAAETATAPDEWQTRLAG